MSISVPIILSINVHEKPNFLMRQIENIKSFVKCEFIIILNCNDYMCEELKKISLPKFVHINPEIINKVPWTGLITKGIYSNMKYALEHFNFLYFIVLSSRNMFYNNISPTDLLNNTTRHNPPSDLSMWHWPTFSKTKLGEYYLNRSCNLYGSEHEGFVITENVCKNIERMLEKNVEIREDIFSAMGCVEEFALQTISMNEYNHENTQVGWVNIGHGCETHYVIPTDPSLFVYKTTRQ